MAEGDGGESGVPPGLLRHVTRVTEAVDGRRYGPAQVHNAAHPLKLKEPLIKKFYVLAALLMATTSAHAGNSISGRPARKS